MPTLPPRKGTPPPYSGLCGLTLRVACGARLVCLAGMLSILLLPTLHIMHVWPTSVRLHVHCGLRVGSLRRLPIVYPAYTA